ncbi:MAG: hypothetical protein ACRDYD_04850, partial [Acidimicrobiales bacterium]
PIPNAQAQSLQTQQSSLATHLTDLLNTKGQLQLNEQIDLGYRAATLPAVAPASPSNASHLRFGGLGALIGLVVGVVAAYVLALTRRRFDDRHAPTLFYGAPLLGDVPTISGRSQAPVPTRTDPGGVTAEAFRNVATSLRALREPGASSVVAFTSARRGAGKTVTVANCGIALAEMGERVLVVDGDPLHRGLTRLLDPQAATRLGLSSALAGGSLDEAVVSPPGSPEGLLLLPAGDPLLAGQRWPAGGLHAILDAGSRSYDFVLVDAPPLGETSYASDVAGAAGDVALVIPHHEALAAQGEVAERLRLLRVRLLGYVYTRAPQRRHLVPYHPASPDGGRSQGPRAALTNGSARRGVVLGGGTAVDAPALPEA